MRPSPQQRLIYTVFRVTKYNINVSAAAGSGKTTTLLGIFELIPDNKRARFMAFNNAIVDELRKKTPDRPNVTISTLHSFGWGCIRRKYGNRAVLKEKKAIHHTDAVLRKHIEIPDKRRAYFFYVVPKIVDLMRCNLLEPTVEAVSDIALHHDISIDEQDIMIAIEVFDRMNKDRQTFDFMDMIYVPASDPRMSIPKYDYILVDESQDMSLCQHALIKKALLKGGRLVTVGDRNQAIYGFAGADADSYDKLAKINGKSVSLPLSVSYRCSKAVVREAQRLIPSISYAPTAVEGSVTWGSLLDIEQGNWILCRNLRPLLTTYMWLLRNKIKSKIRGKEIGEGMIALIRKVGAKTLDGLERGLEREAEKLHAKLSKKGVRNPSLHPKMELLLQKTDAISFLAGEVGTVKELIALIEGIFSDEVKGILLSTIHKAKGLENDRIFFICPELIPSQFATQDWQLQQELNLKYVAITRAKTDLVYVDIGTFEEDIKCNIIINPSKDGRH